MSILIDTRERKVCQWKTDANVAEAAAKQTTLNECSRADELVGVAASMN
jgi:hypothetical protein